MKKISQVDHYNQDAEGEYTIISRQWYEEARDALEQYEFAEEQGRLVILPCKTGDMVYQLVFRTRESKWVIKSVPFSLGCLSSATLKLGIGIHATREEAEEAIRRNAAKEEPRRR